MHLSLSTTAQRWSVLTMSLILLAGSATVALAQPYTYETIDLSFFPFQPSVVEITAITNLGKLAGTFITSDIGPGGSWTWINAQEGFRKVSFKDRYIRVQDMNGSKRLVGVYGTAKLGVPTSIVDRPFTINSGTLTTLKLLPVVSVGYCSVNDTHDIVCTGRTAQDVIQAVRVKGSTPGVLETYTPGVMILGQSGARDVVGVQWDPFLEKFRGYYRQASTGFVSLIDAPCGLDTVIVDINLAGTVAAVLCGDRLEGGFFDETEHPVRSYVFDGETWTEISVPGSTATRVRRINDAGQVVGQYSNTPDAPNDGEATWQGFIVTPGGLGEAVTHR